MRALPAVLLTILAASACSSAPAPESSPSPTPSADPVNVAACQAFARAKGHLREMATMPATGVWRRLMVVEADKALNAMAAADLATGDVRTAMDRAVAAVKLVRDRSGASDSGTVDLAVELDALHGTLADVVARCREAGADVDLGV